MENKMEEEGVTLHVGTVIITDKQRAANKDLRDTIDRFTDSKGNKFKTLGKKSSAWENFFIDFYNSSSYKKLCNRYGKNSDRFFKGFIYFHRELINYDRFCKALAKIGHKAYEELINEELTNEIGQSKSISMDL